MTRRRRWPRPTVRLRLTVTYTALFVVTGAALLGVSYLLVQQREKGSSIAKGIICSRSVSGALPQGPGALTGNARALLGLNQGNCSTAVNMLFGSSSGSNTTHVSLPAGTGKITGLPPSPPDLAGQVHQLAVTVQASQAHTLDSFRIASLIALGIFSVVSFGLSWWMAGRALRPVHRITDAARALSEHTLDARISLRGPNDELKQLADTFDAMLARLERAFHSQRRFVANASHELRTPLAVERVLIDEALADRSATPGDLRSILEQLRANSEDTERLIGALLLLARSERAIEKWSPVDLTAAASSVVGYATVEADGAGVTIEPELQPVSVPGNAGLLERLAGNLVENAVRHNVAGGFVRVRTWAETSVGVLEVENSGPVVDPSVAEELVEPFRRAGPDRSSTGGGLGLGLSIVDVIVGAHHGRLQLIARPEGGLTVRVSLPRSSEPSFRHHALLREVGA